MYKKILAPVDLAHPETAKQMAHVATERAKPGKADLVLLNVVPELPGYVAAELPSEIHDRVTKVAADELAQVARDSGLEGEAELIQRSGRPHNQILQVAEEIGADLIVIASHQPGFGDFLLGSVAAKVVRHAQCSVLVERHRS